MSFVDRNWIWSRSGLALSLIMAVAIAWAMLMPLPPRPHMPAGIDKIYHFLAFMALVFPVIVTETDRWTWVVPSAIAYGGLVELMQPVVGRSGDWLDFGASVSGVLAGAALAEILHNRIRQSVVGADADLHTELPLLSEGERLEKMRTELMAELRAVLREELDAASRRGGALAKEAEATSQAGKAMPARDGERIGALPFAEDDERIAPVRVNPAHMTPDRLAGIAGQTGAKITLRTQIHAFEDEPDDDLSDPQIPIRRGDQNSPGGEAPLRH